MSMKRLTTNVHSIMYIWMWRNKKVNGIHVKTGIYETIDFFKKKKTYPWESLHL